MREKPPTPSPATRPRPSLREERKEATRDRILSASRVCFERRGIADTRFDEIAIEAGISRATLYLHFDNKDAVLMALLAVDLAGACAIYDRLDQATPEAVRAWLVRHIATLRGHRGDMRLFHVAMALNDEVRHLVDRHRDRLVAQLGRRFAGFDLSAAADPRARRAAALLILARVDHLLSASVGEDPPFDIEAGIDLVAREFAAGLAGPPALSA